MSTVNIEPQLPDNTDTHHVWLGLAYTGDDAQIGELVSKYNRAIQALSSRDWAQHNIGSMRDASVALGDLYSRGVLSSSDGDMLPTLLAKTILGKIQEILSIYNQIADDTVNRTFNIADIPPLLQGLSAIEELVPVLDNFSGRDPVSRLKNE